MTKRIGIIDYGRQSSSVANALSYISVEPKICNTSDGLEGLHGIICSVGVFIGMKNLEQLNIIEALEDK